MKEEGKSHDEATLAEMEKVRETYDRELDAKHAAARGLLDAIVTPENLLFAFEHRHAEHRRIRPIMSWINL